MRQILSFEETKKLVELGVPTFLASEDLVNYSVFTIGDLLEILPKKIEPEDDPDEYEFTFFLKPKIYSSGEMYWNAGYEDYDNYPLECFENKDIMLALFDLVLWTFEKGYLKAEDFYKQERK